MPDLSAGLIQAVKAAILIRLWVKIPCPVQVSLQWSPTRPWRRPIGGATNRGLRPSDARVGPIQYRADQCGRHSSVPKLRPHRPAFWRSRALAVDPSGDQCGPDLGDWRQALARGRSGRGRAGSTTRPFHPGRSDRLHPGVPRSPSASRGAALPPPGPTTCRSAWPPGSWSGCSAPTTWQAR